MGVAASVRIPQSFLSVSLELLMHKGGGRGVAGAEFEGARIEAPNGVWGGCAPPKKNF